MTVAYLRLTDLYLKVRPVFSPDRSQVLQLVAAAVRAPSADNRHHVRFAIHDDGLALHADDFFLHCRAIHRRLLTLLSYGAVVENLRLKLTEYGWTFEPRWFPDPDNPALLLRIEWSALRSAASPEPLARFIESRHTNRRFFRGPGLSPDEFSVLAAAVGNDAEPTLEWFDTPDRRRAILKLIRVAETERFGSRVLHEELFESIDFDAGWKDATTELLAPATLEIEPIMRMPFRAMRRWPLMRAANRLGAHRGLGLRAGDLPARTAPHLGALTSMLPPNEAALAIGTGFQRLWLAAEQAGLALQPMVASAILATQTDSEEGVSDGTREVLKDGWRSLVGEALPLVVFRLGHARKPRVVSGRRAVEDYLM